MMNSDRLFRLWEAKVSHNMMFLRSAKGEKHKRNIDVVFANVQYMELPSMLRGITQTPVESQDIERASRGLGAPVEANQVFVLLSEGRRHVVVAGEMVVEENDLDIFTSAIALR